MAAIKRLGNFDLLRLLLAVEVPVYHILIRFGMVHRFDIIPPVATFLCISGFMIPKSLRDSKSYGHFAWKRVLRVGPAFFLSLLLVVVLFGFKAFGPTLRYYALMGFVAVSWNPPLWSLMLEELLYGFHALTRALYKPVFLGLALALFAGLSIWSHNIDVSYKLGVAACFFTGNLVDVYRAQFEKIKPWVAAAVLASVMAVNMLHPNHWTPMVLPLLAVVAALRLPQINWKWPDLSYGIYVYHMPIAIYLISLHYGKWETLFGTIALCSTLAWLSWTFVEAPVLARKNKLPHMPKWRKKPEIVEAAPYEPQLQPASVE